MKKFFQRIWATVSLVFGNAQTFEKFLEDHVDEAIYVVGKVKQAVENPVLISLMGILPPQYKSAAGAVLAKVDWVLSQVLTDLGIGNNCFQLPTTAQKLKCFIDNIKNFTPAHQEGIYLKMATLYTTYKSGTTASRSAVDTAVQGRFYEQFGEAKS
jgi:hypothetical protein